ncbi:hypothetical protein M9434_003362 [Picochlorum sp. BPE23]|nr:hypothetical protein M9434_003362 [Picochlorum sp. BPE23]
MSDLNAAIDWSSVECLNATGAANVLKQGYRDDGGLLLKSEVDEQILLHLPFVSPVRISRICFKSTVNPGAAPKSIKFFINRPTIGFGEAVESPAVHSLTLTEETLQGDPIPLPVVKFRSVRCLTVFVESNMDDADTTIIQSIAIIGDNIQDLNVSAIQDVSKQEN